jgi:hypothetical protein
VAAVVALPLVLPPTVIGFYLLVLLGPQGPVGQTMQTLGLDLLPFTFPGLVVACTLHSLPFVVQPLQQAFEAIGPRPLEVAATLRASPWEEVRDFFHYCDNYLDAIDRAAEHFAQGPGPIETLAVMREPISWLGSWYRFRRRPFMEGKPNATFDVSFDDFVSAYMQGDPPGFANVGSQSKFLEPRPTGTGVDHMFRYEDQ